MNLTITDKVAKWYKKELEIDSDAHIRFFPRYGFGGHIPGFSIGINHDLPDDTLVKTEIEGITFYVETKDSWYFDDIDLHVSFNEQLQEPTFSYHKK